MQLQVTRSTIAANDPMRLLFLAEGNFQFIHNKCHLYGWADSYVFHAGNEKAGYGAVWGGKNRKDRDTIFEFYVLPSFRHLANSFFVELQKIANAPFLECQTNDPLLSSLFFEHAFDIRASSILFADGTTTVYDDNNCRLKKIFNENPADCHYKLLQDNQVVASGGLMLNYNHPYADIYYDVKEEFRKKGFGTLLVQELKNEARLLNKIPSARCNVDNIASKRTLQKAGFVICGYLLQGQFRKDKSNLIL